MSVNMELDNQEEEIVNSQIWMKMDVAELFNQLTALKSRRDALIQLEKGGWLKPLDIGIQHLEVVIQQKTKTVGKVRQNVSIL